ncbi:MAG: iron-sulfur cluster insertion protein ErpA [Legionellales bacterium]|nr:iron-sulfur cluster insertion protein ErpA [Legionellales bacterium]|tara:strand:+ start:1302 stop:1658 length:357 start_codon:yes stop_codon:yes gene_type:complete
MTLLSFTDHASEKIHHLTSEAGSDIQFVRIFAQGGGCSGLEYGFKFAEETLQTDSQIHLPTTDQVSIVVDSFSLMYIKGTHIDYVKDVNGERFIFDNPNAMTTCGCGSSFAVQDEAGD